MGLDDFNDSKLDNFLNSRSLGYAYPTPSSWALGERVMTYNIQSSNTIGSFKNIDKDK